MVQLEDPFGNLSPPSVEPLVVDTTGPALTDPQTRLHLGPLASTDGMTPVTLSWSATDAVSGLASAELTGACGTTPTTTQTLGPTDDPAPPMELGLRPGDRCGFTSQATDNAGHLTTGTPQNFALALREQTRSDTTWQGSWNKISSVLYSGGSVRSAGTKGAAATFRFTGTDVAFVTSIGPNRGKVQVLVDGVAAGTLDLYAARGANRQIVFTRHFAAGGTHTLRLRVLGTRNSHSKGTRVDVDAFLVLTP